MDYKNHSYEDYNQDSNSCCTPGCYDGIKTMFNKIKLYRFKKVKPSNRHLSKLLLGDDY
jgi:hypothetical protein